MDLFHGSSSPRLVGRLRTNERDAGWFGQGFYLTGYEDYAKRWGQYVHIISIPDDIKLARVNAPNGYDGKIIFEDDAGIANEFAGGTEGWILDELSWAKSLPDTYERWATMV